MNIDGMVHVNINCTDYERSRAFYKMLGFEEVWQVPATNSPAVNAAVAMQDYRVTGAIMRLRGVEPAVLIDLLQWHQPEDHSPPYPNLHRPGLARLALRSSDLTADYEFLCEQGVEVLSPPATVYASAKHGSRFFCFKDPDGTFLELVEQF
jgi:catechol 2,3-dioxygenase-like lactoylglutathione lyase family enzyme